MRLIAKTFLKSSVYAFSTAFFNCICETIGIHDFYYRQELSSQSVNIFASIDLFFLYNQFIKTATPLFK